MLISDEGTEKVGNKTVDCFQYHIWFSRFISSKLRNLLHGGGHVDMQMKVTCSHSHKTENWGKIILPIAFEILKEIPGN